VKSARIAVAAQHAKTLATMIPIAAMIHPNLWIRHQNVIASVVAWYKTLR
jgi:hypothetical protein